MKIYKCIVATALSHRDYSGIVPTMTFHVVNHQDFSLSLALSAESEFGAIFTYLFVLSRRRDSSSSNCNSRDGNRW